MQRKVKQKRDYYAEIRAAEAQRSRMQSEIYIQTFSQSCLYVWYNVEKYSKMLYSNYWIEVFLMPCIR